MQRIIREDEPDKPSTRLSAIGEALTEVAKHRQTSPDLLRKLLRGDLDLIVMKTLEKDRTRRYERAVELAADVERHLNNKPVLAAPPSMTYRLRKFIRRNRVAVITVCLVAVALAIGVASTSLTLLTSDRLTVTVEQPTPNYRLVLNEQIAGMYVSKCEFSPDGEQIVFKNKDNLYITDQSATTIRPLLDDLGPWETTFTQPRWSPDGRLIAYSLLKVPPPDSGGEIVCAVFVIDPEGGSPRQIGPDVDGLVIFSLFWTPDGENLTYRTKAGTRTLTLDGKEVRFFPPLRKLSGASPGERVYAPYGSWLVTARLNEDRAGRNLYILPVTGDSLRRLTDLPGFNRDPTWSPDGRTIYFVSAIGDASNIWKLSMDPETGTARGEPKQVTFFEDTTVLDPQVLGDGSRIAFSMFKVNTYVRMADSSSPEQARSLARCGMYLPELSPDGQTAYYVNDMPGKEGIYAVSGKGGVPRKLTESLPYAKRGVWYSRRFGLSPDGRTLAYSAKLGNEHALFTLPTSGGEPKLLAELKSAKKFGTVPQWSPDGSQLAYADGNDLCVIPAAGGQPRRLVQKNQWAPHSVRWSPDGEFVAALARSIPQPETVFVVPSSGGKVRQLTFDVDWKGGLEWHPNGKRLTYCAGRGDSETRQVYLDGREPTVLVNAPDVCDYLGSWAPDGRRFFFVANDEDIVPAGTSMYVHDEALGETTLVSSAVEVVGVPRWSRDGKTMAWWETRETSIQTWIMEDFLPESIAGK
jgi:Tol biopolymer transport system component